MTRKLQHTLTALTATSAVLAVLLLAGRPALPDPAPRSVDILMISADAGSALDTAGDASDVATDPAIPRHRPLRRTRALLALPYFSFAQGLRHNRS